jgi:ribokinase
MKRAPHVVVVGSCNIDLTFRMKRLPQPGETHPGIGFQLGYGGKGANQAVMAARLGARVTMIGRVGADAFGEGMLANFRAERIDASHVRQDPKQPTGSAAILVDDRGQNSIVVVPGANGAVTVRDLQESAAVIQSADALLCQLEVPAAVTNAALKLARTAGVRTILNPAPAAELPDDLLQQVDVCIPNESELAHLCAAIVAPTDIADLALMAASLLRRGVQTVIVTLGERGALFVDAGGSEQLPAPVVQPVDSSGAGDAFIGAFAVARCKGDSIRDAIMRANSAAAGTVTRLGTQASFPAKRKSSRH